MISIEDKLITGVFRAGELEFFSFVSDKSDYICIKTNTFFTQVVSFLNRSKFNRVVSKENGNKYVKYFTSWNELLSMMIGQLINREILRYFNETLVHMTDKLSF